jgi:hypothetical protein
VFVAKTISEFCTTVPPKFPPETETMLVNEEVVNDTS